MKNIFFRNFEIAFKRAYKLVSTLYFIEKMLKIHSVFLSILIGLFVLILKSLSLLTGNIKLAFGESEIVLSLCQGYSETLGIVKPERNVCLFLLFIILKILSCLLSVSFKRTDSRLKLTENIIDSDYVILSRRKTSLRFLLLISVLGYTCGLFKDISSVLTLARQYL